MARNVIWVYYKNLCAAAYTHFPKGTERTTSATNGLHKEVSAVPAAIPCEYGLGAVIIRVTVLHDSVEAVELTLNIKLKPHSCGGVTDVISVGISSPLDSLW